MDTQPDFEGFLRLLETNRVDDMIVGGYAVAYHGCPRFTKDIDVFFDAAPWVTSSSWLDRPTDYAGDATAKSPTSFVPLPILPAACDFIFVQCTGSVTHTGLQTVEGISFV